jgi:hypothetical protein
MSQIDLSKLPPDARKSLEDALLNPLFLPHPLFLSVEAREPAPPALARWWYRAWCGMRGHGKRNQIDLQAKTFWVGARVIVCQRCGARVRK